MSQTHSALSMQNTLPFGVHIRPRYRLSEVERLIKKHRIIVPCPSRNTLIRMLEDGTFEGEFVRSVWFVFEDSFWSWAGCDMSIAA